MVFWLVFGCLDWVDLLRFLCLVRGLLTSFLAFALRCCISVFELFMER